MNLSIDERTKHRLTGLVVLIAIAIIFLPAMLRKSNQRLEESIHLSVQIPPKPTTPKVAVAEEKAVFETVKVEKLPMPNTLKPKRASQIARIDNLKDKPKVQVEIPVEKSAPIQPKVAKVIDKKDSPVFVKQAPQAAPLVVKSTLPVQVKIQQASDTSEKIMQQQYSVQLASFAVQQNAEKLVSRLKEQGYKARYQKIASGDSSLYKVTVGQLSDRADAKKLQEKLSKTTQIDGFIVKRDVS